MEIALIIYGIGFVVMLFILLWIEEWHPTNLGADCLLIMSMLSWMGVCIFAYIWIECAIDDRKFIKELKRGDYDDSPNEMWEFNNCHYKGNCLMDCTYRSECPFYSYSK